LVKRRAGRKPPIAYPFFGSVLSVINKFDGRTGVACDVTKNSKTVKFRVYSEFWRESTLFFWGGAELDPFKHSVALAKTHSNI